MYTFTRRSAALWVALAGLLLGCNNDGSSNSTGTGVNVAGNWTLSAEGETSTMHLSQNGDALTGSVQGAPLTGSVSGNNVSISTGIPGGPLLVADGTVAGNAMSGNYTATEAGGTQHTGTWSATKQ